ncbi:hypothetical protein CQ14_24815 [Bradyrhizobium lablabi]|uniref:Uncharacterized protein n=1 Tax=Bradyrhizobium lablabi TaxID=722472 RepID=A0A0R3MEC6_9BRAD|nr:hypothetical protein [Bradyrhizobium lablabi]KRR18612.1 hypothetical protein CQ14_24815 [Bradyrhizobium lablabi]
MDANFTVIAGGPGTDGSAFERELAVAVAGEVEREGPTLGAVADLWTFVVTHKEEILVGFTFAEAALQIVDRLIELATRRGSTIKVVDRGREVTVETSRRQEAADVVRAALERSAPAGG